MRSPTSEVGESFSMLRDSLSILEENKTFNAQLDPEGRSLTLMVSGDNGKLTKMKLKVNLQGQTNNISDEYDDGGMIELRRESLIYGAGEKSPAGLALKTPRESEINGQLKSTGVLQLRTPKELEI